MACSTPLQEQRGDQSFAGDGPVHLRGHAATNGSNKNNDRIFDADEGSVQREGITNRRPVCSVGHANEEVRRTVTVTPNVDAFLDQQEIMRVILAQHTAHEAQLTAMIDQEEAAMDAISAARADKYAAALKALEAQLTALMIPGSPTSIIETTTASTEPQSLEPKQLRFVTDAPNAPEPESLKLAGVVSGSTQFTIGTAHAGSKMGEYVKFSKVDASLSLEPVQSFSVNTHDAMLRTPEPFVATVPGTLWEKENDPTSREAVIMTKPQPPPFVEKSVNEISQMGEYDNRHADPASKPKPTAPTTDNGCDDVRRKRFFQKWNALTDKLIQARCQRRYINLLESLEEAALEEKKIEVQSKETALDFKPTHRQAKKLASSNRQSKAVKKFHVTMSRAKWKKAVNDTLLYKNRHRKMKLFAVVDKFENEFNGKPRSSEQSKAAEGTLSCTSTMQGEEAYKPSIVLVQGTASTKQLHKAAWLETAASTALEDFMLRPVPYIKLPIMFDEQVQSHVPIDTQKEEAYFSVVFNGRIIISDLGGNNHRHAGVGFEVPNWHYDDDHGAPGHDGDPCAVDDDQWNQEEEFYYEDQEEDNDIYDITEHDDGHDDGRDFDDDD